jgi:regulator of protease activity HflC (stomatin/prohibitin superfamily)
MLMDNKAYAALMEANLVTTKYGVRNFDKLDIIPGPWDVTASMCLNAICMTTGQCCCMLKFVTVDPGLVLAGGHTSGTDLFFGPGVHVLCKLWRNTHGSTVRLTEGEHIVNGTKVIAIVQQGFVGLAFEKGEPVLFPPGIHQWDNPDIRFDKMIDLTSKLIQMGPYHLVTVEEGYAAITIDNGKQVILDGGRSTMLTHQNWKFVGWLSCKLQTDKFGPLSMTTGDNIALNIVANVNWRVKDPQIAASRNVDTAVANADALIKPIQDDVILQVTSALAALVGSIQYGSQGTSGIQASGATGKIDDDEKTGRKALWDAQRLANAVTSANEMTERYGVLIVSINLISAAPRDEKLVEIMSRGAVASVSAEEKLKEARAAANALLVQANAEKETSQANADAMLIRRELMLRLKPSRPLQMRTLSRSAPQARETLGYSWVNPRLPPPSPNSKSHIALSWTTNPARSSSASTVPAIYRLLF